MTREGAELIVERRVLEWRRNWRRKVERGPAAWKHAQPSGGSETLTLEGRLGLIPTRIERSNATLVSASRRVSFYRPAHRIVERRKRWVWARRFGHLVGWALCGASAALVVDLILSALR